ncbi:centrosomal protein of 162 kDa-like, partial [Saccoglossus kowalevskii]|uniref:Centrosomal protein of 162 kDa n=1 Tax=Saccoglossus kowalevskii TaxID=10224 RepID=A0ABM0MX45_SACKO
LSNDEDGGKARSEIKTKLADVKDSAEKVKLMEKEMQNQEILLEGYHQENKRLYKEIQEFKTENKEEESKWKSENQKFKTEISNLREQIEEKERQLKNKGIITGVQKEIAAGTGTAVMGAGKIAHLQAEVQEAQVTEIELKQRMKALEGSKSELERYIDVLVKEKKDAEQRLVSAMERKDTEIQAVQNQHEKDTEALHKKLKWYAENQDLLDKDAQALKDKDDDIKRLKEQIEEIQQQKEEKKKLNENQRRAKERAADAKKIQDLERQVKEMENILRRRNPNSLPAMIFAAATAPSDVTHTTSKTKATVFLEERIQKLEKEADEREQEAKRSLRTMEQKYNAMKLKYEERISSLEKELNSFKRPDHSSEHPHSHMVAVEKELKSVRERYQREVDDLKEKLDFLQRNSKTKITGDSQPQEKIIESLQDDVRIRDEELLKLRLKCQQLEVDYMNAGISNLGETKHYTPRNFAGKHISDVMDENARLRQQVERTSFEIDQQRVHVQKSIAEAESAVRKSKEEAEDKISLIRLNHEAELQRIILEHSSKLGDSNVSRLTCQLNAQEVMITHLKEQLSHYKQEAERLKAAEIRERALQQNIYLLSDELKEAKKHHTPAMKHFEALQSKIEGLENRHVVREQELKGIVEKASLAATAQKEEELQYFKQQLRDKNLELQKFRTELDTLLQVMEELQQQGVVIHSHPQKSLTHY